MPNTSRFDQHVHVTRSDSYGDHRGWRTCRFEEPDALMRARPDLWEPWAGNCPGPPGPSDYNQDRFVMSAPGQPQSEAEIGPVAPSIG